MTQPRILTRASQQQHTYFNQHNVYENQFSVTNDCRLRPSSRLSLNVQVRQTCRTAILNLIWWSLIVQARNRASWKTFYDRRRYDVQFLSILNFPSSRGVFHNKITNLFLRAHVFHCCSRQDENLSSKHFPHLVFLGRCLGFCRGKPALVRRVILTTVNANLIRFSGTKGLDIYDRHHQLIVLEIFQLHVRLTNWKMSLAKWILPKIAFTSINIQFEQKDEFFEFVSVWTRNTFFKYFFSFSFLQVLKCFTFNWIVNFVFISFLAHLFVIAFLFLRAREVRVTEKRSQWTFQASSVNSCQKSRRCEAMLGRLKTKCNWYQITASESRNRHVNQKCLRRQTPSEAKLSWITNKSAR